MEVMEASDLEIEGNKFKSLLKFDQLGTTNKRVLYSPGYVLCNTVKIKFRATAFYNEIDDLVPYVFVRFTNIRNDDLVYCLNITSDTLLIPDKMLHSNDGTWHLICEDNSTCAFDVAATLDVMAPKGGCLGALYDDADFADFRLRGSDGSVTAHRTALAAASPVLRRMLAGEWKEAVEGAVDVPGTSTATLQSLKRYIYLRELPDAGFEHLLLLASYYIMPDLEKLCRFKLMCNLASDNAFELLEFAMTHKQNDLSMDILATIHRDKLNIDEMCKNVTICEKVKRDV